MLVLFDFTDFCFSSKNIGISDLFFTVYFFYLIFYLLFFVNLVVICSLSVFLIFPFNSDYHTIEYVQVYV